MYSVNSPVSYGSQPPSKLTFPIQGAYKNMMIQSCVSFDQHCTFYMVPNPYVLYTLLFTNRLTSRRASTDGQMDKCCETPVICQPYPFTNENGGIMSWHHARQVTDGHAFIYYAWLRKNRDFLSSLLNSNVSRS